MTAPARYWRVNFRSVTQYDYAHVGIRHMRLFSSAGTDLTAIQTVTPPTDPLASNVKLLMPFNGNDGVTTFTDISGQNANGTAVGSARLSVGAYKFGGSSLYLDGSSAVQVPGTNCVIGTSDFCIEMWVYKIPGGTTYQRLIQFGNDNTAGTFTIVANAGTASEMRPYISGCPSNAFIEILNPNIALNQSQWYHLAVTRASNKWTIWIDGKVLGVVTLAAGNSLYNLNILQNTINIGQTAGSANRFYGYIDDLRITIGNARYSDAAFTPPAKFLNSVAQGDTDFASVSLLMHAETATIPTTPANIMFTDSSTNTKALSSIVGGPQLSTSVSKFGNASAYFNGSSTVKFSGSSDFTFAGDFTVEAWIRPAAASTGNIVSLRDNSTNGLTFRFLSDGRIQAFYAGGTNPVVTNYSYSLNVWHHVAVVRSSGSVQIYVDGQADGAAVTTWNGVTINSTVGILNIGAWNISEPFQGYIDEVRITAGIARYTGTSYTLPTAAFPDTAAGANGDTNFANVVLLLHFNVPTTASLFTDDSSSNNYILSGGAVTITGTQKKYGSSSLSFTGAVGSFLWAPAAIGDFGSADFTMEAWVYLNAMPAAGGDTWPGSWSTHMEICGIGTPNSADGCALVLSSTKVALVSNNAQVLSGFHYMTTGTWTHVAATRYGDWFMLFVNGSIVSSIRQPGLVMGSGLNFYVGSETGEGAFLNGYLDEVRISKAKSRYQNTGYNTLTTSFAPSSWPVISQTDYGDLVNAVTYPLTALVDTDSTTVCAFNWPNYRTVTNWRGVKFDFGSQVLPEYLLLNISSVSYTSNSLVSPTVFDFLIQSSDDNTNWVNQTMLFRPVASTDTDQRLAVVVTSDLYPIPSRTMLGGDGGIYGIVSEDGVALPNRPVILFERDTFFKIGYTTTDQNGGYAFNGLNRYNQYMVMSHDPSGPPYKNALVWDRISPINTAGNIAPQSAFWARRIREQSLGAIWSVDTLIDTALYDYRVPTLAGNSKYYSTYLDLVAGSQITDSVAGSQIKLIKSNRTSSDTGTGITVFPTVGLFSGVNQAAQPANYSNLTFEYVFKAPQATESSLIMTWAGTRDSDDATMYGYDAWNGYHMRATGPTLEVTSTAINVRFPLGARNRSTVRCTAPVVSGQIYHVMVAYSEATALKLYVNGVLATGANSVGEANISGLGRLWGNTQSNTNFESWDFQGNNNDGRLSGNHKEAYIRRLIMLYIGGTGYGYGATTAEPYNIPNGWGGSVGLVALYGRYFSASDVASFYDSYVNWNTHYVPPSQSGYMAEVESDNPYFYARLNDLSRPTRIESLFGHRGYSGTYETTTVFNRPGFVSGTTSVQMTNGAIKLDRVDINEIFTAEFFVRFTNVTTLQRLFLNRQYNSNAFVYFYLDTDKKLRLAIYDRAGVTTYITYVNFTAVVNTDYHMVVSYDPINDKRTKLYINGVLIENQPATVIPYCAGQDWLGIGCNVSSTGPTYSERVQGDMGEFALYGYPLSAARVAAHYAARNS